MVRSLRYLNDDQEDRRHLPEGFRFLGLGVFPSSSVSSKLPQLHLEHGSKASTLVLFDPCSMGAPGTSEKFDWIEKSPVPIVTLFSSIPLEIDAINYGLLDAFQYALFSDYFSDSASQKDDKFMDIVSKIIDILGREESEKKNGEVDFSKITPQVHNCVNSKIKSENEGYPCLSLEGESYVEFYWVKHLVQKLTASLSELLKSPNEILMFEFLRQFEGFVRNDVNWST